MHKNFLKFLAIAAALVACDGANSTIPGATAGIILRIGADNFAGTVGGDVYPVPTVRVDDRFGNPLPGAEVVFSDFVQGLAREVARVRTDQAGTASVGKWTLGPRAGRQTLRAVSGRSTVNFSVEAGAGPAVSIAVTNGTPQVGFSGFTLSDPLRVRVLDRFENPVEGWIVNFAAESGGGSTSISETVTNGSGVAESFWTLGAPGSNTARASISGVEPVRFTAIASEPGVLSESAAFELTEIRSVGGDARLAVVAGRYLLGKNGKFTALVDGIAGDGRYTVAGTTVVFYYNNKFLDELANLGVYPLYPAPSGQESARIDGDFLSFSRCVTEDCYEFSWVYRKLR